MYISIQRQGWMFGDGWNSPSRLIPGHFAWPLDVSSELDNPTRIFLLLKERGVGRVNGDSSASNPHRVL